MRHRFADLELMHNPYISLPIYVKVSTYFSILEANDATDVKVDDAHADPISVHSCPIGQHPNAVGCAVAVR
jgi:hypothetical protein